MSAARELKAPILLSANAFSRYWPTDRRHSMAWPGFRKPNGSLAGVDAALDSAGFVAMALHRGYPWTVAKYVGLAGSYPWAWWAQMDCCCEPEVAADRDEVMLRIAETARLLGLCRREALHQGTKAPMPVLQGWWPDDYARSADLAPLGNDWPELVGVGSVCRRQLHGPHGLLAVVDRIDRIMPSHVRLHLFGVKGSGMSALRGHHRVASVDSQAWDMRARRTHSTSRTMQVRIAAMQRWYAKQRAAIETEGWHMQSELGLSELPPRHEIDDDWLDLVASGEVELQSVSHHAVLAGAFACSSDSPDASP